jgi:hypothetical protein
MYANCPKSWELAHIKKLKTYTPTIHTVFGTSLHETLQHYLSIAFTDSGKKADSIDICSYLQERMMYNYTKELEKTKHIHFSTPEDLKSFYEDGCEILTWVKRRRQAYFTPKGFELLGIELPLYLPVNDNPDNKVYFVAYIDLVLYDKVFNRIKIFDIKTSTRGWSEKDKSDPIKKSQVMLYKHYFSKAYNVNISDIEVEFFVVKRKLYEESKFPQKRVQSIIPPQGKSSVNKVITQINNFVQFAFKEDGQYNTEQEYPAVAGPGKENCKYCEFKDRDDLCPTSKRLKALPD